MKAEVETMVCRARDILDKELPALDTGMGDADDPPMDIVMEYIRERSAMAGHIDN
jgi:hypothetical protein